MNTKELESILKNIAIFKKYKIGVYACDDLPLNVHQPFAFIVNNKPKSHSGEHWTAIFLDGHGTCIYFDSFSKNPDHVLYFLKRYKYNQCKIRLQNSYSDICGGNCLLFLYFLCKKLSLSSLYQMFSKNLIIDDKIMYYLFEKYFHKYSKLKCKRHCYVQVCICKYKV
jgi:hypothetical protein